MIDLGRLHFWMSSSETPRPRTANTFRHLTLIEINGNYAPLRIWDLGPDSQRSSTGSYWLCLDLPIQLEAIKIRGHFAKVWHVCFQGHVTGLQCKFPVLEVMPTRSFCPDSWEDNHACFQAVSIHPYYGRIRQWNFLELWLVSAGTCNTSTMIRNVHRSCPRPNVPLGCSQ